MLDWGHAATICNCSKWRKSAKTWVMSLDWIAMIICSVCKVVVFIHCQCKLVSFSTELNCPFLFVLNSHIRLCEVMCMVATFVFQGYLISEYLSKHGAMCFPRWKTDTGYDFTRWLWNCQMSMPNLYGSVDVDVYKNAQLNRTLYFRFHWGKFVVKRHMCE